MTEKLAEYSQTKEDQVHDELIDAHDEDALDEHLERHVERSREEYDEQPGDHPDDQGFININDIPMADGAQQQFQ